MAEVETVKTAETTPNVETKTPDVKALQDEITRLKTALSKSNSEAADNKRKLQEKMTEAEKAEEQRKEENARRDARLAELEAKDRLNTYKERLMDAGFDAATATSMAKSLPEGVGDDYFTAQKTFFEAQREAIKAEMLKNQPGLSVGMPPKATDAQKERANRLRGYAGLPPLP